MADWTMRTLHLPEKLTTSPSEFSADFQSDDLVLTIDFELVGQSEKGTVRVQGGNSVLYYRPTAIHLSSQTERAITSADTRNYRLGHLVNLAGMKLAETLDALFGVDDLEAELDAGGAPVDLQEVRKEWPKGDLEKVYKWVARIYEDALRQGDPPSMAVGREFDVSIATAKRMVAAARKAGVLNVRSQYETRTVKDTNNGQEDPSGRGVGEHQNHSTSAQEVRSTGTGGNPKRIYKTRQRTRIDGGISTRQVAGKRPQSRIHRSD